MTTTTTTVAMVSTSSLLHFVFILLLFCCGHGQNTTTDPSLRYIGSGNEARRRVQGTAASRKYCGDAAGPPCRAWKWNCDTTNLSYDARVGSGARWVKTGRAGRLRLRLFPSCDTEQLTRAHVLTCLRGRHIVFLGDSLTRYQYLSLVQFLELGLWQGSKKPAETEHVKGWPGSFNGFFMGVNARFRGREICDCARGAGSPALFENRYYYNPVENVRVTFLWRPGVMPMSRHSYDYVGESCMKSAFFARRAADREGRTPPAASLRNCAQRGCTPGKCVNPNFTTHADDFEGAYTALRHLAPDAVIINVGLWTQSYASPAELQRLIQLGRDVRVLNNRTLLYWKTTTHRIPEAKTVNQPIIKATLREEGWRIVDAGGVTHAIRALARKRKDLYYDRTHFAPFAYRGLNELLLADLCSSYNRW